MGRGLSAGGKDGIVVIERYERGGLVAYSVDEGKTYHPTVRQAFMHKAGVVDLLPPTNQYDLYNNYQRKVFKSKFGYEPPERTHHD